MDIHGQIMLPNDLLGDAERFDAYARAASLAIEVSPAYLEQSPESKSLPEVIAIHRLISLARRAVLDSSSCWQIRQVV
jgi:hypothetical protein